MTTMRDFFAIGHLKRFFPHLQKRLDLANAYQRTFGGDFPEGRIVLRDLLTEGGLLSTADDPADSRFYEGKRAMALHIVSRLRWSHGELLQLGQDITHDQLAEMETSLGDA